MIDAYWDVLATPSDDAVVLRVHPLHFHGALVMTMTADDVSVGVLSWQSSIPVVGLLGEDLDQSVSLERSSYSQPAPTRRFDLLQARVSNTPITRMGSASASC